VPAANITDWLFSRLTKTERRQNGFWTLDLDLVGIERRRFIEASGYRDRETAD
jgi:hypothetical protein